MCLLCSGTVDGVELTDLTVIEMLYCVIDFCLFSILKVLSHQKTVVLCHSLTHSVKEVP